MMCYNKLFRPHFKHYYDCCESYNGHNITKTATTLSDAVTMAHLELEITFVESLLDVDLVGLNSTGSVVFAIESTNNNRAKFRCNSSLKVT